MSKKLQFELFDKLNNFKKLSKENKELKELVNDWYIEYLQNFTKNDLYLYPAKKKLIEKAIELIRSE